MAIASTNAKSESAKRRVNSATKESERLRRRKKSIERFVIFGFLGFLTLAVAINWSTDGWLIERVVSVLQSIEGKQSLGLRGMDCSDPRNSSLPYCEEPRARTDHQWQSMSRVQGGKNNPFTLYSPKKAKGFGARRQ